MQSHHSRACCCPRVSFGDMAACWSASRRPFINSDQNSVQSWWPICFICVSWSYLEAIRIKQWKGYDKIYCGYHKCILITFAAGFIPVAADKSHARIIWDCAWAHEGDVFATASRDKTVSYIWLCVFMITRSSGQNMEYRQPRKMDARDHHQIRWSCNSCSHPPQKF